MKIKKLLVPIITVLSILSTVLVWIGIRKAKK